MNDNAWQNWLYSITWQEQPRFDLSPDYIVAVAKLQPEAGSNLDQHRLQQHLEAVAEIESLAVEYILQTFAQAGVTFEAGQQWSTEQFGEALDVIPLYRRFGRCNKRCHNL